MNWEFVKAAGMTLGQHSMPAVMIPGFVLDSRNLRFTFEPPPGYVCGVPQEILADLAEMRRLQFVGSRQRGRLAEINEYPDHWVGDIFLSGDRCVYIIGEDGNLKRLWHLRLAVA